MAKKYGRSGQLPEAIGVSESALVSRESIESAIGDLRQAIDHFEAQARVALERGREDLARDALTYKVLNQKKLSRLETRLRRRDATTQVGNPPDTGQVAKTPPTPASPGIALQIERWHNGPGGTAMGAITTDVRDIAKLSDDLTAATRAADGTSVKKLISLLRSASMNFESHVSAAMAAPPIPDAESQRLWASALVNAHAAATEMRIYTETRETARLRQSGAAMSAYSADMHRAAERAREIKGTLRLHAGNAKARTDGTLTPRSQAPQAVAPGDEHKIAVPSLESLLTQLDSLIGLAPVKADVRQIIDLARVSQMRQAAGLPVTQVSRHLVFTGNPGTGKTTVARLLGQVYAAIGVLRTGQLVEVARSDLVAGYVGQTAIKTANVANSALGGVLFIDEAYSLARPSGSGQDFGQEVIDTFVKIMEDNRDQLIVIVAGYGREMADFIKSNPGLPSRFPRTIHFPDYTDDELVAIFEGMCSRSKYELSPHAFLHLSEYVASLARGQGFGNGRLVRNMFEAALARQASRIIATGDPNLTTLTARDLGLPMARSSDRNAAEGPAGPYI